MLILLLGTFQEKKDFYQDDLCSACCVISNNTRWLGTQCSNDKVIHWRVRGINIQLAGLEDRYYLNEVRQFYERTMKMGDGRVFIHLKDGLWEKYQELLKKPNLTVKCLMHGAAALDLRARQNVKI